MRILPLLLILFLSMLPILAATGTNVTSTNVVGKYDYQNFKIIAERNIFNPNRSARSTRNETQKEKPKKIESFALRGTMSYEKGTFAFFDGSSSEFRKALGPKDSIAGFTITAIEPNNVKLEHGGNTVNLAVGQQMKREDEGEWSVGQAGRSSDSGGEMAKASSPSGTKAASDSSGKGEASDVVKRLRMKREQELKK
jgi:hypothetical protein